MQSLRRKQEIAQVTRHVPRLTIDGDRVAAAAGDVVHDGGGRIQLLALLIEVGAGQVGAAADLARGGFQITDQELDQRRLTAAVGTDDTDAVAAHDACGKIRNYRRRAEGVGHMGRFEHQLAGRRRILSPDFHLPDALTPFAALYAQLFERTYPALVARAPCLHALANPNLFLGQLLVEQGGMLALDFERRTLLHDVVVIVARPDA